MSLPAEIRIQIYKIATSNCICVPYRPRPAQPHCVNCPWCYQSTIRHPVPFPPHVKALLQVKQIRDDMLPHLHLAWVGGFSEPFTPCWHSFKRSAIPVVTHLTIGVKRLFCSQHTILCGCPGELLHWMRWRSQRASRYRWNMSHLTLIEGSRKWPSNPCGIGDFWPLNPPPESKDTPEHAEALAEEFPMIKGLRRLKLVLSERRGPVFLERLSKRFEAHGIDVKVTVQYK